MLNLILTGGGKRLNHIPKICYLYWNNAPMSLLHTITVRSFHKYNPDWEIIIYNFLFHEEPSYAPKYIHYSGKDYFAEICSLDYVEIINQEVLRTNVHSILFSDRWRREKLYETGGVYSDFDVIWLKPMEHLLNVDCVGNPADFSSIVCYYAGEFHNVSILISEKESAFDREIIEAQKEVNTFYDDQCFGTTLLNKLYPSLVDIRHERILAIPYETFYPYSTYSLAKLFLDDDLKPLESMNVMAVHWFNGNPLSKIFINNELYYKKCSMNSILKREGYVAS